MKVMAIIDLVPGADLAKVRALLSDELRASWRLYASDVLREAYATASPSRVVFVLEAASADDARARLEEMPLVRAKLLSIEIVELRPFANWAMLFSQSPGESTS